MVLRETGFNQELWLMSAGEYGCSVLLLLPVLVNVGFDAQIGGTA
jgi:hypothetical protein